MVQPLGSSTSNKTQSIFYPSDFNNTLPGGAITRIFFKAANSVSSIVYSGLTIKLGHTSNTSVNASTFATGLTTVYTNTTTTLAGVTAGNWFYIDLQSNFIYDGISNLIVEVSQNNASMGTGINLQQLGTTNNRTAYGAYASSSVSGVLAQVPAIGFGMILSNCTGTPNPGTVSAANNPIDCGSATTVTLNGQTQAGNMAVQWQYYNTATSTWTNFGQNLFSTATNNLYANTQIRAQVSCLSAGGGTANSAPLTVSVLPMLNFLGNDTSLCLGTYALDAGNPGSSYLWNTSATTQSINVTSPGTYYVKVTKANGCLGYDTITISGGSAPVNNLPASISLCDGHTAQLNAGNTGSSYSWNTTENTQSITVNASGNYSVVVTNLQMCSDTFSTNVQVHPNPVVDLGADTLICGNASYVLDAGNAGSTFLWNNNSTNQTLIISDSGTYSVQVTSPFGCTDADTVRVAFKGWAHTDGFNFEPLYTQQPAGLVKFTPINPQFVDSFYWDFGDGTGFSTAAQPVHQYAQSGDYLVMLSVFNDCGWTDTSLMIQVDLQTNSIRKVDGRSSLNVYPNPSQGTLTIQSKQSSTILKHISVVNAVGQLVAEQAAFGTHTMLQLNHLATGIYVVRVETNKGIVYHRISLTR